MKTQGGSRSSRGLIMPSVKALPQPLLRCVTVVIQVRHAAIGKRLVIARKAVFVEIRVVVVQIYGYKVE